MAIEDDPAIVQLIPINLATICMESFLYGLFFVLYGTSTYVLVRQGQQKMASEGQRSRMNSVYRAPMFLAAHLIFLTVTSHWVLTVYRLFQAFVNYRGGTQAMFYYASMAFTSEVARVALLVSTVLVSDATIIYRLYIIWGYNKLVIIPPLLTWCGLMGISVGVCWQFSKYKIGDIVYTGPLGHWITADGLTTLVTNVYCSACISYRVFRTRRKARKHPSLASPNLLSALAILVESAALHTAWNAVFLASFQRAIPFQFSAIDLWSPIAGIAFMLINLRVALGWAQRAHWHESGGGSSFAIGVASGQPTSQTWKRTSYGFAPDTPSVPFGPGAAYTAHPQRTRRSARFSYLSDWEPSHRPERLSYAGAAGGPHTNANPWQDQPWVIHAQPHPYALAANEEIAEVGSRSLARVPLAVNVRRVVDRKVDEEKSGWVVGEAV